LSDAYFLEGAERLIKDENLKFLTKVQGGHPDIKR
jgi:hypothetical protein